MKSRINFGSGEYEKVLINNESDSLLSMRCTFLHRLNEMVPKVADELNGELLELYRQIPLFYFEADKKRNRKSNQKNRLSWYTVCRPNWEELEIAWSESSSEEEFYFKLNHYYYAENDEFGYSILPIFEMPLHKDPKITLFVKKMFEWSRRNHIDKMWCRKHAFETLDLWSVRASYREARVWQMLPALLQFNPGHPITILSNSLPNFETKMTFDLEPILGQKLRLYPTVGFRQDFDRAFMKIKEEIDIWKQQISVSLDQREKQAEQEKFDRTPFKIDYKHFDWLIYDLFEMKTNREMANSSTVSNKLKGERENDSTKKVRKAINELSKLIDLPLNPKIHRSGRPRKQKEHS